MKIVDANVVLRYLLQDNEKLSNKAKDIIENNEIFIPTEVIAEIVYVLEKVYSVNRKEINKILSELLRFYNITTNNMDVIKNALKIYSNKKLDFVDTILISYNNVDKHEIFSFDKKLNKLLYK
ncbi:PIN domain-containing protein [Geotoga petraea]|jgi:predicted nucleic-acid-binding protein|uniref:Predicted nucleic-acid-binding protein, contains PIN domain n=1 Tax=Geotoga petraea TaxID=28234 RepID=A0A1G6Q7T0_9BACT|nr:PIN domain-containing protein [Geotoga petraea]SDC88388.1 Predicted nucleic-acid-binding protein, contains PIN domain [Geotoga petraea]